MLKQIRIVPMNRLNSFQRKRCTNRTAIKLNHEIYLNKPTLIYFGENFMTHRKKIIAPKVIT